MAKGGSVHLVADEQQWRDMLTDAGRTDRAACVDFTATWCGPCKAMAPVFEDFARKYPNVLFLKVDVDENKEVAMECGVTAMPTFQVFVKGKKVADIVGANPKALQDALDKYKGVAFQGSSRTLAGAGSSVPAAEAVSGKFSGVDESKPVTTIRFRLPDGGIHTGQFNSTHTIADIRRYLRSNVPVVPSSFNLLDASFPPKVLTDNEQTVEGAGLLNSQIIVRQC